MYTFNVMVCSGVRGTTVIETRLASTYAVILSLNLIIDPPPRIGVYLNS